jgi:hypothetical protein
LILAIAGTLSEKISTAAGSQIDEIRVEGNDIIPRTADSFSNF